MYHIKSDRRSQRSAETIVRGLEECLKAKPLSSITVSDIHHATGISRATFYRLFDTPEDVLQYRFDTITGNLEQLFPTDPGDLMETLLRAGSTQHDLIRAVIESGRLDLLIQSTEQHFRSIDEKYGLFPEAMDRAEREYVIIQVAMNVVGSILSSFRSGEPITVSQELGYMKSYIAILTGMLREEKPE